jgi:hypothetical protein
LAKIGDGHEQDPGALSEREEIELLLPWYVMGRLDRADAARVEACLAQDADLARQLELIRAEQDQSLAGNAAIAERPASNVNRLMADVAKRRVARAPAARPLWDRMRDLFALPETGTMRWAAAAAAVLIVVQAGAIGTMLVRQTDSYLPASGGSPAGAPTTATPGTVALVGFVGGATTSAVVELLAAQDMSIVDGPNASGFFTVRIGPGDMSAAERAAKLDLLKRRGDIVAEIILLR